MTFLQMQQEVARHARMQMDNSNHISNLKFWINRAQEDVQGAHSWWFLSYEFELSFVEGQRVYPFPDTDMDATTADLESIDVESMRTKSSPIGFVWPSQLDQNNRSWTDSSLAGTGSPEWWTTVRERIVFSHFPSATFVTNNPKAYFRGWARMPDLVNDGDISLVPKQFRNVIVQGAKWRAYERQGVDDWRTAFQLAEQMTENMIARCRPVRGGSRKISAPTLFRIRGRRSSNVVN